jgi:adenosylcobinamide-phosphate synthase
MFNPETQTSLIILLAVALDRLLGEPVRWHPIVAFGKLATFAENLLHPNLPPPSDNIANVTDSLPVSADSSINSRSSLHLRIKGALALAALLIPSVIVANFLSTIPLVGVLFQIAVLYASLGGRSLSEHAKDVSNALKLDDLPTARQKVSLIVSRDTNDLGKDQIAKAAIESVLENGNDAVFGALFWFAVGGAPGVVLYRLTNTLDAMWGYKNDRYLNFGWAAAKLDDLLNLIPARLTAFSYAVLGNCKNAFDCWRTQAKNWYSPNAGPVMASGAGSLSLRLGGDAIYQGQLKHRPLLGSGNEAAASDIVRALTLVNRSLMLWMIVFLAVAFANR